MEEGQRERGLVGEWGVGWGGGRGNIQLSCIWQQIPIKVARFPLGLLQIDWLWMQDRDEQSCWESAGINVTLYMFPNISVPLTLLVQLQRNRTIPVDPSVLVPKKGGGVTLLCSECQRNQVRNQIIFIRNNKDGERRQQCLSVQTVILENMTWTYCQPHLGKAVCVCVCVPLRHLIRSFLMCALHTGLFVEGLAPQESILHLSIPHSPRPAKPLIYPNFTSGRPSFQVAS